VGAYGSLLPVQRGEEEQACPPSEEEMDDLLIYNYDPVFSGRHGYALQAPLYECMHVGDAQYSTVVLCFNILPKLSTAGV